MNYANMFDRFMAPFLSRWFDQAITITTDGGVHELSGMALLQENAERRSDVYDEDTADLVMRIRKTTTPALTIDALRRSKVSTAGVAYTVIALDDDGVYWRLHLKAQETSAIRDRGRRDY